MSYKVCVIGDVEDTFPFLQIGMDIFPALYGENLLRKIIKLEKDEYGLIFITEDCLEGSDSLLKKFDKNPKIALIPFPSLNGETTIGKERIQDMVEKALGKNIL